MRKLLLLIFCLSAFASFSQNNFKNGFIVSLSGDTSKVVLKEDIEEKLSKGVWVKQEGGKDIFYTTATARAFGFEGASTYEAITFKSKLKDSAEVTLFAKYLIKGVYSLYSFMEDGAHLFLVRMQDNSVHLMYNKYNPIYKNVINPEDYRNKLIYFSTFCPKQREIAHRVSYSERSMIIFIYDVNDCVKPGFSNQKIYYKKPKRSIIPSIYVGALPMGDRYEFTGQFNLKFTLPSVSRTLSVNTGIVYYGSQRLIEEVPGQTSKIKTQLIGIPITLQQYFTQGVVQAYVYAGIGMSYAPQTGHIIKQSQGFQENFGVDLIGGLGIDVKLTEKLLARADWRYEVITHYPTIGIAYKFK